MRIKILIKDDLARASVAYILHSINPQLTISESRHIKQLHNKNCTALNYDLVIIDSSQIRTLESNFYLSALKNYFCDATIICLCENLNQTLSTHYFHLGINACIEKSNCKRFLETLIDLHSDNFFYLPCFLSNQNIRESGSQHYPKGSSHDIKHNLTTRQMQVLSFIQHGKSNKEIGGLLDLSEGTVRTHIAHIFNKLNVSNRTEAVHVATRLGVLS